jgi:hypothetical protein
MAKLPQKNKASNDTANECTVFINVNGVAGKEKRSAGGVTEVVKEEGSKRRKS